MKSKQEALITKWAPVNILDIRRTEAWLEHMAARGLIYQRQSSWNTLLGEFFCTVPHLFLAQFQKKEPQISRRYRLVPAPKNQRPSPEQLELYAHSGWQYVDFIDLFYASFLLFFSDDPGALEPYTDPDSFRLAYRFPVRGLAVVLLLFVGFDVLYQVLDFVGGGSASPDGLPALQFLDLAQQVGVPGLEGVDLKDIGFDEIRVTGVVEALIGLGNEGPGLAQSLQQDPAGPLPLALPSAQAEALGGFRHTILLLAPGFPVLSYVQFGQLCPVLYRFFPVFQPAIGAYC